MENVQKELKAIQMQFDDMLNQVIQGDCLETMRTFPDNSFDSMVCDPPAAIGFMGKQWDSNKGGRKQWIAWLTEVMKEALRVLKPGAHILVWGIPRTSHWTATAIEEAGFELRDIIHHCFGSGFPKSLDLSKAIDKEAGAVREVVGSKVGIPGYSLSIDKGRNVPCVAYGNSEKECQITTPSTPLAKKWDGWGTGLKPAIEHWILARKPISEKTIAKNVLRWGVGSLNIAKCRVRATDGQNRSRDNSKCEVDIFFKAKKRINQIIPIDLGRFPANLIHDGSDEVLRLFPITKSGQPLKKMHTDPVRTVASGASKGGVYFHDGFGDSGSAARFFYCSKATKRDRDEGLNNSKQIVPYLKGKENWKCKICGGYATDKGSNNKCMCDVPDKMELVKNGTPRKNGHPTVKSTRLMRYLCRLITPPNGLILDCFAGSGSTGKAAVLEGFRFVGIEAESEYVEIANARIQHAIEHVTPRQLELAGVL